MLIFHKTPINISMSKSSVKNSVLIPAIGLLIALCCPRLIAQLPVHHTNGIDRSNALLEKKIGAVMKAISNRPPAYEKAATDVAQKSDKLSLYIEYLKQRIINESGGMDEEGMPEHMDNIDVTTNLLVTNKAGDTLQNKMNDLRRFLLHQVQGQDSAIRFIVLKAEVNPDTRNPHQSWAEENFNHMPVIAAITILTKYQNDVRSSELVVLNCILDDSNRPRGKRFSRP